MIDLGLMIARDRSGYFFNPIDQRASPEACTNDRQLDFSGSSTHKAQVLTTCSP
ncbi:MAG: hypothetical protein ACI9LO_002933 [Planctomycetota bacterium]